MNESEKATCSHAKQKLNFAHKNKASFMYLNEKNSNLKKIYIYPIVLKGNKIKLKLFTHIMTVAVRKKKESFVILGAKQMHTWFNKHLSIGSFMITLWWKLWLPHGFYFMFLNIDIVSMLLCAVFFFVYDFHENEHNECNYRIWAFHYFFGMVAFPCKFPYRISVFHAATAVFFFQKNYIHTFLFQIEISPKIKIKSNDDDGDGGGGGGGGNSFKCAECANKHLCLHTEMYKNKIGWKLHFTGRSLPPHWLYMGKQMNARWGKSATSTHQMNKKNKKNIWNQNEKNTRVMNRD